jgi:hypothetical protein
MQNNVIYGAFGQKSALETASLTRVADNTPTTLNSRIQASKNVLRELSALIAESGLPKEAIDALNKRATELQDKATSIATQLVHADTDNQLFLQVQTELADFGHQLVAFEADVMHQTGAELELVEAPPPPVMQQMQTALRGATRGWKDSPRFWIGLSVGVAALGGLLWWGFQKEKPPTKEDFTSKVQRVKLRRALPAR